MVAAGITFTSAEKENACLLEIDRLLRFNGKTLHDFSSLPVPENLTVMDCSNHFIVQELCYDRQKLKDESVAYFSKLNSEQLLAFNDIMEAVNKKKGGYFFVYGYGGTGKTFLWNALASTIR